MLTIFENAQLIAKNVRKGRDAYRIDTETGYVVLLLSEENMYDENSSFLVQAYDLGDHVAPITWSYVRIEELRECYLLPKIEFVMHSDAPTNKIQKPSELRGRKPSFSIVFQDLKHGKTSDKVTVQCFVSGNDIWIKHSKFYICYSLKPAFRDFDSVSRKFNATHNISDFVANSLEASKQFDKEENNYSQYSFCYRGAWLCLKNTVPLILNKRISVSRTVMEVKLNFLTGNNAFEYDVHWHDFFEKLCIKTREVLGYKEYLD